MPTTRAWVLITLAILLYLLANQTQVGWIYVMSNAIAGLLLAAFLYSRGGLKPVTVRRTFRNVTASFKNGAGSTAHSLADEDALLRSPEFYEDDPVEISLTFRLPRLRPAFLITGADQLPFAPPDDRTLPFFVPAL